LVTQNLATEFGVAVSCRVEVQFSDGGGFVFGYGFQEWRRAVLAFAEGDKV